jgi:hypothetical protein
LPAEPWDDQMLAAPWMLRRHWMNVATGMNTPSILCQCNLAVILIK